MRLSIIALACLSITAVGASPAWAVSYASMVRNTGGSNWEFVLNQSADSVTITRDGGDALALGSLAAGRHTFDMTGFNDFEIEVSNTEAAGWATISDSSNLWTNYERAPGLAVNSDPSSPYFGAVYVGNARDLPTASGRTMGDGIYSLSADLMGIDLTDFSVETDPNDASLAKVPTGWSVADSSNSPWRMTLDDGGNLIVSDWSDANGGVKYASADLASGGLLLATQGGPTGGVDSTVSDEFGPIPLHGSIVSTPTVTGTVGQDLTLWAMDEDLDVNLSVPGDDGNSIWRWDVGAATEYSINPELTMDVGTFGNDSDGGPIFLNLNIGVLADAYYSPQFNKWYLTDRRSDGNESGLIVVTADDVDGTTPTLEWASKQFSIDNQLDGYTDDPEGGASEGLQDIFRELGSVTISPDGTKMFVSRVVVVGDTNPYLGTNSGLGGRVLVIPLDENGIPDIQVDDNGTPDDSTDDTLVNVEAIFHDGQGTAGFAHGVSLDAAGNVYTTNNISELLQVFSPGGAYRATTTSDGAFSLEELSDTGLAGDYNLDGIVNAADYTIWRDSLGDTVTAGMGADGNSNGAIDAGDFEVWKSNFGASSSSSLASAAVPEPATWCLAAIAAAGVMGVRRRRRRITGS